MSYLCVTKCHRIKVLLARVVWSAVCGGFKVVLKLKSYAKAGKISSLHFAKYIFSDCETDFNALFIFFGYC